LWDVALIVGDMDIVGLVWVGGRNWNGDVGRGLCIGWRLVVISVNYCIG
jgi:hypothetical protein